MTILTRDQILQADDLKTEKLYIEEWNGHVLVRMLTGKERDDFESSFLTTTKKGKRETNFNNLRARLVALCVVDEEGKRVFSTGDVQLIGQKASSALNKIFTFAQSINGMTQQDVDELLGNSAEDQTESFTSD